MSRKLTDKELANLFRYGELVDSALSGFVEIAQLVTIADTIRENECTRVMESNTGEQYIIVFSGEDDAMDGYEVTA